MALRFLPSPASPAAGGPARGFTFLELIVVMGILAMLMGLTVGYIRGAGRVGALGMARSRLLDSAYRAQGMSVGERIAMLTFRESRDDAGRPQFETLTSVADVLVTHSFETLDGASLNLPHTVQGPVKKVEFGGRPGSCASFERGGVVAFDPQARFAAVYGLDAEMWILPTAGQSQMTLVEGQGAYELALVRGGATGDYDLRLRLNLVPEGEGGEPTWVAFESQGQPVKVNGRWIHVHASFDGLEASFRVDGLESVRRSQAGGAEAARAQRTRRIAVPAGGAVALTLGSVTSSYVGKLDTLVLRGVFPLADERLLMPEGVSLRIVSPSKQGLPYRVTYRNGRLDPDRHGDDVIVSAGDDKRPQDPPLMLRLSRHGSIRADLDASVPAPAAQSTPTGGP